jgi:dipeptidase E
MAKIYLLGGENVYRKSAQPINEAAIQDAGKNPNVLVFPWARATFDRRYRKRNTLTEYLLGLGAGQVDFIDYSEPSQYIAQRLEEASFVYLTGGVPSILLERLKAVGVDKLLLDFEGVIVGRSAGALALCRRCIVTGRTTKKVKVLNGLGLANLTLKTHYKPHHDPTLRSLSICGEIYAVPKSSAIIYDSGKLNFLNPVYLFSDGERFAVSGPLGFENP